jgi:hypothetical protein
MRTLLIALIRLYQRFPAPLLHGSCRFTPTCSTYACDAIERHGVIRGLGIALRRVSRCHPLGSSGFDPVP